MKIQKFTISQRLPGLNDVIKVNRRNQYAGANLKKEIDESIMWQIQSYDLDPITRPCEVIIYFYEMNHRRDVDNIQSATKFIMDALTKTRIIVDDSPRYVRQIHSWIKYTNNNTAYVDVFLVEGGTMKELWDDEDGGLNDIRMGG